TASLIEAEWKRIVDAVDDSETVPGQVKTAVGRFDDAVGDLKDYVATNGPKVVHEGVRRAREAGVPIPEDWVATDDVDASDLAPEAAESTPFTDGADETADDVAKDAADAAAKDAADADDDKS
ncbi:MAG: hypothetical protein AAGK32_19955, partial [Actinomycetota bacterium]